ncbi:MAG: MarR family winged helix-turn-helix transcriptional regulator [Gaiellales bacterium]
MIEPPALASDLRVVIGRLVRRLRAERRGFPLARVFVLAHLDRNGPTSISALAAADRVRPQSMAATVAALEADGLVERGADPSDRRRVVIGMTPAGREVLAADRAQREGWLAEAIARDLSPRERRMLADATLLLGRLAESRARGPER